MSKLEGIFILEIENLSPEVEIFDINKESKFLTVSKNGYYDGVEFMGFQLQKGKDDEIPMIHIQEGKDIPIVSWVSAFQTKYECIDVLPLTVTLKEFKFEVKRKSKYKFVFYTKNANERQLKRHRKTIYYWHPQIINEEFSLSTNP